MIMVKGSRRFLLLIRVRGSRKFLTLCDCFCVLFSVVLLLRPHSKRLLLRPHSVRFLLHPLLCGATVRRGLAQQLCVRLLSVFVSSFSFCAHSVRLREGLARAAVFDSVSTTLFPHSR